MPRPLKANSRPPSSQVSNGSSSRPSSLSSSHRVSAPSNIVIIPPDDDRQDGVISKIEQVLESMVDALLNNSELVLPYRSRSSGAQRLTAPVPTEADVRPNDVLRFPARNLQELEKFGRLSRYFWNMSFPCGCCVTYRLDKIQKLCSAFSRFAMKHFCQETSLPRGPIMQMFQCPIGNLA